MKTLLLGSTGLLGQAVAREARRRGAELREAARRSAPIQVDIADDVALCALLDAEQPDLVVNCAALVDIDLCEKDPSLAWHVNARPLAFLAAWSKSTGGKLLHISTDHYFTEGAAAAHAETAPVSLVNEYARCKFAGEAFALTAPDALVLRTSIVGIRGWERPTFAEWAIDAVENDRAVTLFSDAWSSSIDVTTFARAAFDLAEAGASGLYNLAAHEVYTKEQFVREITRQRGLNLTAAKAGSVRMLSTPRAHCLGLDVRRAEAVLGYELPHLAEVVASVLQQYRPSTLQREIVP
ncbi:MAG: sugar nucleotide-binding protein [Parvibaculum sp.]|uniref:SDR family oxidoreductase n=1 Tax=Parvibaculum sp. TaxID=2024848 RepID=UPI002ABCA182|nr:sugar nucleotide-binding protein [Parvibaculum sp.]MDZ4379839.1 sugar nucleotide-binding protein [Parvibaculum sp.]